MALAGSRSAVALLTVLVLFLFRDSVFRGQALFERDIHAYWSPQVAAFVRAIAAGSLPLWNPYAGFGQPYLANPSTQVFHPFTWLNLFVLPSAYYTLFVVAHLAFTALGFYRLGRTLALSHGASLTGAALWTASGPLLSLVNLWHHLGSAAFMPWVLLMSERACASRRLRDSLLWGATAAGQILAGSADMCAMTWLLALANAARHLEARRLFGSANGALLGRVALASGFALALSAAQWLPTLELALGSPRASLGGESRNVWPVHPWAAPQLLLPILFDELPYLSIGAQAPSEIWQPFIRSFYLGLPALGLVLAGLFRGRLALFVAAAAVLSLLIALGRHTPVYEIAVSALPPLKILRYPSKVTLATALLWALLAAMGFEGWRERSARRGAGRAFAAVVLAPLAALVSLAWVCVVAGRSDGGGLAELLALNAKSLLTAAAAGSVVLLAGLAGVGAPAVALLSVAELAGAHSGLNPTAPTGVIGARPAILEHIQRTPTTRLYVWDYGVRTPAMQPRFDMLAVFFEGSRASPRSLGRALGLQEYLYPPQPGRWGLFGSFDPDVLALDPAPLSSLKLLLRVVEGTPAWARLLEVGAVDYVVALHTEGHEQLVRVAALAGPLSRPIRVFRHPAPLPRTYAVGTSRIADGDAALRTLIDPEFDPQREVILAKGKALASPSFRGSSRLVEMSADRVVLETDFDAPGYAVVVDAYDPGWKAEIDGTAAPVLRANVAFRAVAAPAGRHRIELSYRPRSVAIGLAVSLASLAVGVAAFRRSEPRSRPVA